MVRTPAGPYPALPAFCKRRPPSPRYPSHPFPPPSPSMKVPLMSKEPRRSDAPPSPGRVRNQSPCSTWPDQAMQQRRVQSVRAVNCKRCCDCRQRCTTLNCPCFRVKRRPCDGSCIPTAKMSCQMTGAFFDEEMQKAGGNKAATSQKSIRELILSGKGDFVDQAFDATLTNRPKIFFLKGSTKTWIQQTQWNGQHPLA